MKEKPILFSAPMVRSILSGTKTQTRRVVKPQPEPGCIGSFGQGNPFIRGKCGEIRCPYGQPGDRLWVRETFCPIFPQNPIYNGGRPIEYDYAATYKHGHRLADLIGEEKKWKPSIHMPRRASRILLEITGIRVERLNDISKSDAEAEGIELIKVSESDFRYRDYLAKDVDITYGRAIDSFASLWESINGPDSWAANPWVWVVEFRKV